MTGPPARENKGRLPDRREKTLFSPPKASITTENRRYINNMDLIWPSPRQRNLAALWGHNREPAGEFCTRSMLVIFAMKIRFHN